MDGLKSYKPLYLKYRPQSLSELVGQSTAARTLNNAIDHNRLTHAYLFTGPRGTGKTSTARILAKSLNCEQGPTATPCQKCTACEEIKEGVSPAVFELDAASNNSVDDARLLIERAPLVAVGGRYKLYIIDECHMLTKEAFNALLKTLEEPPNNVVFILATTEEHKVPPTIVSRCQKLMFRLVSQGELAAYLSEIAQKEGIKIDSEAIELIARRSGGGLRDALGLLDQASLLSSPDKAVSVDDLLNLMGAMQEDALISMSRDIMERQGQKVLTTLNELLSEGREPAILAQELALHFLNLTKASYVAQASEDKLREIIVGSPKYLKALAAQVPNFDRVELAQMIEQLDRLDRTIRYSTQPALHLEMGLLSLCHRHEIVMVRDLVARIDKLEALIENGAAITNQRPVLHETKPLVETKPAAAVQSQPKTVAPVVDEQPAPAAKVSDTKVEPTISLPASPPSKPESKAPSKKSEPASKPPTDSNALVELEMFWEQLLEWLDNRHKPTHSVLSIHASPVSLGENDFVVGLHSANLQKTIEDKAGHIKAACEALLGRVVAVRVKIISKDARISPRPAASGKEKRSPEENNDPGESDEDAGGPKTAALRTSVKVEPAASVNPKPAGSSTEPPKAAIAGYEQDDKYGDLIQEAYRLFDGPGSRRIG